MHLSRLPTLLLALTLAAPFLGIPSAWAARQYRCSGKVQYRPCETSSVSNNVSVSSIGTVLGSPPPDASRAQQHLEARAQPNIDSQIASPLYARVLKNSFAPAINSRRRAREVPTGTWRGLVEGNGMVHLFLEILRGNKVQETRFMGNVLLKGQPTTFAFVSPLPSGSNWSWRISAIAKNPFQS